MIYRCKKCLAPVLLASIVIIDGHEQFSVAHSTDSSLISDDYVECYIYVNVNTTTPGYTHLSVAYETPV